MRDHVRKDLKMIECDTLRIHKFSLKNYKIISKLDRTGCKDIFVNGDKIIKDFIKLDNGEFLGISIDYFLSTEKAQVEK